MVTRIFVLSALFILMFAVYEVQAAGDSARGAELNDECTDCHGEHGMGDDEYPKIAGLDEDYLLEQLKLIKKGERSEEAEMMLWFFEDLEEQDLEDLAAYYAFQKGD